ncbi:hypothetical protein J421_2635 [Gemmatirosa kalamazoonensis]|uniref:Outer membrane protein beta-barrel domain-containing protein n=1 Tax=Gemmatirosa kalamazoonensis TaxID=861299 RepID=W0RIC5_9BACT|nr:hypothetical protein [Gemmatirosa kalamazoonensis]AHG90172.1 hypothetical protein J421_2635 [Gemmatirosa kalamazoonensis]
MGQLPGLPVFQGAFPAPGLAVGADVGRDAGRTMLAGAVGYGPRSGRFGLVAGAGVFTASAPGFGGSRFAYGARFALRAVQFANQRLAITPFAGFGSTRARLTSGTVAGLPATPPDIGKVMQMDRIPLGIAAGGRFRIGDARALALSLAPAYTLDRRTGGSLDATKWNLRVAAVADLALTSRLGVSLASEFGQSTSLPEPGPTGSQIGLGVSFAFARR